MMKINQNIILKSLALLLCFYIAILPIFQYKTVKASTFDKVKAFTYATVEILMGLKAVGFISDTTLTPENLENIYNKADAYLHENFGTELEYAEALRQVDQLGLDIASGQIFVPGNYSGKLWYSFLNAVKDVLYPNTYTFTNRTVGVVDGWRVEHGFDYPYTHSSFARSSFIIADDRKYSFGFTNGVEALPNYYRTGSFYVWDPDGKSKLYNSTYFISKTEPRFVVSFGVDSYPESDQYAKVLCAVYGIPVSGNILNPQYVPNMTAKTANKVKLPTRLPQTVINNINNYIDGSSENLIVNPTPDELPTLPDNYNPSTDDPPDLPGYEDVTPDQPGTTDPEPTPSPTPEPTPTPPEYDGSSWIKPIGDFFAGLLSFLKDALIPTQTVDFSPLQNMGADVSGKFPFSLPGDIGKLFGVLNAEPIRPHFEMDFDLSKVGIPGEPIHWDLNVEQWDNGAAVVKTALYIAFLIGLVFITKQFMQN